MDRSVKRGVFLAVPVIKMDDLGKVDDPWGIDASECIVYGRSRAVYGEAILPRWQRTDLGNMDIPPANAARSGSFCRYRSYGEATRQGYNHNAYDDY